MKIGDSPSESSDACLLLSLPEDSFAVISRFLSPSDICNLSLCCKSLSDLVDSEKIWFVQCEVVKALPLSEIFQWRTGISSYKSLCRFLVEVVNPLVGIWVHQNPELGNVVYVMPGFLSVVGCRIIPQEVGPLGIQEGRVMWSPVFEIISGLDGGSTAFFLHGIDRESSCLYPGFVTSIDKCCNVLLLEVEPRRDKRLCGEVENGEVRFPFCKLPFAERRKLLYMVTGRVGLNVPEVSSGMIFPHKAMSLERRAMLLKMHKFGGNWNHMSLEDELCYDPIQVDINELWTNLGYGEMDDENEIQDTQRKSLSKYFRSSIKRILRRSSSSSSKQHTCSSSSSSSSSEIRRSNLQTFLSSGDSVGLSVKATQTKLSSYRGWPNMHETRFALYKLPSKDPVESQEYAGLWGGTFGWPPGKFTEDKPGKALFLLMLTYEEESRDDSERLLIGTKILEGTHYVMHPNGSAMFVVKIGSPSSEIFPFDDTNGEEFEHCYTGEGIAKGYGFRYPGYKPGSLFVTSKGLLVFVWKETKVVLTLQRLDLEELLKKGVCVSPLPPCLNFTYLTKSHTNVFASGRRTS
ncbi:F-box protein At5g39450 isoform X1 [Eutrema salsugineum]|nr:F-box protein At5g39450 isoform X1 [Eutrema salsugineum]